MYETNANITSKGWKISLFNFYVKNRNVNVKFGINVPRNASKAKSGTPPEGQGVHQEARKHTMVVNTTDAPREEDY